jgi:hypothetical protein
MAQGSTKKSSAVNAAFANNKRKAGAAPKKPTGIGELSSLALISTVTNARFSQEEGQRFGKGY